MVTFESLGTVSYSPSMAQFDRPYATFCWTAIVIGLSCTIFECFDVE